MCKTLGVPVRVCFCEFKLTTNELQSRFTLLKSGNSIFIFVARCCTIIYSLWRQLLKHQWIQNIHIFSIKKLYQTVVLHSVNYGILYHIVSSCNCIVLCCIVSIISYYIFVHYEFSYIASYYMVFYYIVSWMHILLPYIILYHPVIYHSII